MFFHHHHHRNINLSLILHAPAHHLVAISKLDHRYNGTETESLETMGEYTLYMEVVSSFSKGNTQENLLRGAKICILQILWIGWFP